MQLFKRKEAIFLKKKDRLQKCATLKRWKMRSDLTIKSRFGNDALHTSLQLKYRKAVFLALKKNCKNIKHLVSSISNLEQMMRVKICADSFKSVKSFSISKGLVIRKRKAKASEDLFNLVRQQYLKRIGIEFQRYKKKCMTDEQKRKILQTMLGHQSAERVRDVFRKWRQNHNLMELKDELTNSGPERAAYWEAMRVIENLKDFMREEHFTEAEIRQKTKEWFGRNEQLMYKYIARMKMRQEKDRRYIPMVWNRWRQYTGMRKLIKYQMRQM
jgi:predicted small metal-binding protein